MSPRKAVVQTSPTVAGRKQALTDPWCLGCAPRRQRLAAPSPPAQRPRCRRRADRGNVGICPPQLLWFRSTWTCERQPFRRRRLAALPRWSGRRGSPSRPRLVVTRQGSRWLDRADLWRGGGNTVLFSRSLMAMLVEEDPWPTLSSTLPTPSTT